MKKNVGTNEGLVRLGLGVLAGVAAWRWSRSRMGRTLLGAAAVSGLQSGLTHYCAMKHLLGLGVTTDSSGGKVEYQPSSFDNAAIPAQSQGI